MIFAPKPETVVPAGVAAAGTLEVSVADAVMGENNKQTGRSTRTAEEMRALSIFLYCIS